MKLSVLSVSNETITPSYISDLETFSGKAAGVCYMKEQYFDSYVSDPEKAKNRFDRVIGTGHHSIADHSFITVLLEDIPKITAMVLNSLGFYNTSEKSGRYTVMSSDGMNKVLYEKWKNKFIELITNYDITIDEKLREKLAMENARYMLSVFEPSTTMMYTTSLRMWSYLVCWLKDYLETADESTEFDKRVKKCLNDLYLQILATKCYSTQIVDNKNKKLNFLSYQVGYPIAKADECYKESYTLKYSTSFASLAQLQRHRTIDYFMCFNGNVTSYYVPELIKNQGKDLVEEWLTDLNSISDTYPNATLVDVVEQGTITNFMLKCDERLCGRTQLETFHNVRTQLFKLALSWDKSEFMLSELEKHIQSGNVIMKCGRVRCAEPCHWGAVKAQTKLI